MGDEGNNKNGDADLHWSFGFGSNMDVQFVESQKQIKVLEHTPAVLHGFKLAFNYLGTRLVEPAFGNLKACYGEEVHGVAFCMTREAMEKMKSVEIGYRTIDVTLVSYDGRNLRGFIFIKNIPLDQGELTELDYPSKRYLDIILNGARRAGLKKNYLEKLEKQPYYTPPDWVLELRKKRPKLSDLQPITLEELAQHKSDDNMWWSILGYVIKPVGKGPIWMDKFRGRDVTTTMLHIHNNLSWFETNTDRGLPPYPLVKDMDEDEVERLTQFLDYFQAGSSPDGINSMGEIVGHLFEFKKQQESGKTDYKMPNK